MLRLYTVHLLLYSVCTSGTTLIYIVLAPLIIRPHSCARVIIRGGIRGIVENPVRKTNLLVTSFCTVQYAVWRRVGQKKTYLLCTVLCPMLCPLKMGIHPNALSNPLACRNTEVLSRYTALPYGTSYCMAMRMAVPVDWVAASYSTVQSVQYRTNTRKLP